MVNFYGTLVCSDSGMYQMRGFLVIIALAMMIAVVQAGNGYMGGSGGGGMGGGGMGGGKIEPGARQGEINNNQQNVIQSNSPEKIRKEISRETGKPTPDDINKAPMNNGRGGK